MTSKLKLFVCIVLKAHKSLLLLLQNRGHKEDILAVAQCPNIHLLATASYDGQVIVWNMVSGHIFAFLDAGCPPGYEDLSCE